MADEVVSIDQHSPQVKWQNKKQQAGLCRACGADRRTSAEVEAGIALGLSKLKQLCRACQDKANAYMNSYRKTKRSHAQEVVDAIEKNEPGVTGEVIDGVPTINTLEVKDEQATAVPVAAPTDIK